MAKNGSATATRRARTTKNKVSAPEPEPQKTEESAPRSEQFRISRVRALRGPNYWRLAPVIACDVTLGDLENVTSAALPGLCERLVQYLPTLRDHPCSRPG